MKNLIALLALVAAVAGFSGCQTLHYRYQTPEGDVVEASSRNWLWEEEIEGFKYDHKLGQLEVKTRKSGSDEAAIKALADTIKDLAAKVAAGAVL